MTMCIQRGCTCLKRRKCTCDLEKGMKKPKRDKRKKGDGSDGTAGVNHKGSSKT